MRRGFMPSRASDTANHPLTIPPTTWFRTLVGANLQHHRLDPVGRYWLQLQGSLTRALQLRCHSEFHVEISYEGFFRATPEEARTLAIPFRQYAWIREVRLCGDGEPWVLARTVIPRRSLQGSGRRLKHLGRRPLGAYLFSNRRWQRGPLQTGLCRGSNPHQPKIARRSRFYRENRELLVSEYFLPALLTRKQP